MNKKIVFSATSLGFIFCLFGIYFAKNWSNNFGKEAVQKTLSAIEKAKKMETDQAFDFEMKSLSVTDPSLNEDNNKNQTVLLSSYKGKIILLNFWASWCEPCISEFPDMIGLAIARPDVRIVAVNRDTKVEDALKFIESFPESLGKIDFYWDPKGEMTSVYGTEVLPESYLIGRDFKLKKKIVGIEKWNHPKVLNFIDNL